MRFRCGRERALVELSARHLHRAEHANRGAQLTVVVYLPRVVQGQILAVWQLRAASQNKNIADMMDGAKTVP